MAFPSKKQRGFTVIELLSVVAILVVLAAIVMVNVMGYVKKSKDSAIKGTMNSLVTDGAVYYDAHNGNYGAFCNDTGTMQAYNSIHSANKHCKSNGNAWAICAQLNLPDGSLAWCADSTGRKESINNTACKTNVTACP